jgi:glycosyltransferase involved in cell wall biosynthesis
MRILHVTPYFAPAFVYGGPPRSILGLCHALQRAGTDVEVVTTTANGNEELPSSVSARREFARVPVTYVPRTFPKHHFNAASIADVLNRRSGDVDVVHVHGCWNLFGWAAARWCRRRRIPYVVSPRGMLHQWSFGDGRAKKWVSYRVMEAPTLRRARILHATTVDESEQIAALRIANEIVVVPNGLDDIDAAPPARSDAFRASVGCGPDDFLVLFLARIHPKKGLDTLLDAVRRTIAHHPNVRLLVAGTGEQEHVAAAEAAARDLMAAGHVRFAGHVSGDNRRVALASADAFALTSHSENFGLSIAEAMAAGLPVIVSRACPWPQIDTWRAGFWIENTAEAASVALCALASDRAMARDMGQNGRREIRLHLDWQRIAADMLQMYARASRRTA